MDDKPQEVDRPDCHIGSQEFFNLEVDEVSVDIISREGGIMIKEATGSRDQQNDLDYHVDILVDWFVLVVLFLLEPVYDC